MKPHVFINYICTMTLFQIYKNDTELIAAIRRKERKSFEYLYRHKTAVVKNFVLSNGGHLEDAEEIEQNVIIHLYEKIVSGNFELNENTQLSTYLYAVGKNMWYKKLSKANRTIYDENITEQTENIDFYNDDESEYLEQEVVNALQNSDDDCKAILTMYYYDKKSMRDIAESLGTISEENLRKRKYKCIQKLKKMLTGKIKSNG